MALEAIGGKVQSEPLNRNFSYLESQIHGFKQRYYNVEDFREPGMTDEEAFLAAYHSVPSGAVLRFDGNKTYEFGTLPKLEKPVQLDFNGATVLPNTTGVMMTLGRSDQGEYEDRFRIENFMIRNKEGVIPQCIFKIEGALNPYIHGHFRVVEASHSLVWNKTGYGLRLRGEMRRCTVPRHVLLSHSFDETAWSYDFDIDIDITGRENGTGIEIEGGNGKIRGVYESLERGIHFTADAPCYALQISAYFEKNSIADIDLEDDGSVARSHISLTLQDCLFHHVTTENKIAILLGRRATIVSISNYFIQGYIHEREPNVSSHSYYIGFNNRVVTGGNPNMRPYFEIGIETEKSLKHSVQYGPDIQASAMSIQSKRLDLPTTYFSTGTQLLIPVYHSSELPTGLRGGSLAFTYDDQKLKLWTGGSWKTIATID